MSTEVYDRAKAREFRIWENPKIDLVKAMGFSPALNAGIIIMIPLEDDRFLQDLYIIQEQETIKYDQLIASLVAELAKINAERTNTLAGIASKRIIKNIEIETRNKKLSNKMLSVTIADELMNAQFDALREDEYRIITKRKQLETAILKANAEIEEIQSKILMEAGNLLLAEIDILKAQQDLAKGDLKILEAEMRVTQIALDIAETLLSTANLVGEKENILADINMIKADILRTGLSAKHLTAEQYEISVELDSITRRLANDLLQIKAKENIVNMEKVDTSAYLGKMASLLVVQLAAEQMRVTLANMDLSNTTANMRARVQGIATPESSSRISNALMKLNTSVSLANYSTGINTARTSAAQIENDAHIQDAINRAKASVASTLQHVIGSIT